MDAYLSPIVEYRLQPEGLAVTVGGRWVTGSAEPPEAGYALEALDKPPRKLLLGARGDLVHRDSSLLVFLVRLVKKAHQLNVSVDMDGLPLGLRRLITLTLAVPPRAGSARRQDGHLFLATLGRQIRNIPRCCHDVFEFTGALTRSAGRALVGRSKMRRQDLLAAMDECGLQALPIISLISLLFGLILAFVGAVQLLQFGAQIYVAGLVGIGMLRVMGAVMVGIVMAGRVGAAYAALIGTMQVNEEVDALATFGFSPVDFLVLPRVAALVLMMPLLTIYADLMGIIGGFLVGIVMLDLTPLEYINATIQMVPFKHIIIGLVYATVFGVIIGIAGCYQGMRCGRSAEAVGLATTAAVVQSIVWIIVATSIITVICDRLGV